MVPLALGANSIMFWPGQAFAARIAWRNEPGPESLVLVTRFVSAQASYAPMSLPSPPAALTTPALSTGRGNPRWSVASPPLWPASIAGLPGNKAWVRVGPPSVSYTHLRAHETVLDLVCRLLLEKKNT